MHTFVFTTAVCEVWIQCGSPRFKRTMNPLAKADEEKCLLNGHLNTCKGKPNSKMMNYYTENILYKVNTTAI